MIIITVGNEMNVMCLLDRIQDLNSLNIRFNIEHLNGIKFLAIQSS